MKVKPRNMLKGLLAVGLLLFPGFASAVGPGPEIDSVLNAVAVADPISYGNLTVWPLVALESAPGAGRGYLTLDRALESGLLRIEEKNGGSVPEVEAVNVSSQPVFIFAGEIIAGARQDRIIRQDTLLAPCGGRLSLAVYCVEQGRWQGRTADFQACGCNAPASLRLLAQTGAGQSAVWEEVAVRNSVLGVAPSTGTLRAGYESSKHRASFDEYSRRFVRIPEMLPGTLGVVVSSGGRIVCADLFGAPELFRAEWEKLLKSYISDVLAYSSALGSVRKVEVESFLARLGSPVSVARERGVSLGENVRLNWPRGMAAGLINRGSLVHLSAFPLDVEFAGPDSGRVLGAGGRGRLSR